MRAAGSDRGSSRGAVSALTVCVRSMLRAASPGAFELLPSSALPREKQRSPTGWESHERVAPSRGAAQRCVRELRRTMHFKKASVVTVAVVCGGMAVSGTDRESVG